MSTEILMYLTPIGIIFLFFIKEFFAWMRERKNNNHFNFNNHFGEVNVKLDNIQRGIDELDRKFERAIELLVLIKNYLHNHHK